MNLTINNQLLFLIIFIMIFIISCGNCLFLKAGNKNRGLCIRLAFGALALGSLIFFLCDLITLPALLVHDLKYFSMSLFGFSGGMFACLDIVKMEKNKGDEHE